MSLNQKKAVDVMKKSTGINVLESSICAIPHGFLGVLQGKESIICVTDGPCAFVDRLECIKDEYRYGERIRIAEMNDKNSQVLRLFIKWTAPSACQNIISSIGLEDEFGLALPILANKLQDMKIKPILISSSDDMSKLAKSLNKVAWQALSAGLVNGYGAEFAYVKDESMVMNVLLSGHTGMVLDCSNKVNLKALGLCDVDIEKEFLKFPDEFKEALKFSYIDKEIVFKDGTILRYDSAELTRLAICYGEVIAYLQYIYNAYFKGAPWPVDFIVYLGSESISDKAQYLLVNELKRSGVNLTALQLDNVSTANMLVANELEHKLSVVVSKGMYNSLLGLKGTAKCLLDLRPPVGQGLVDVVDILFQEDVLSEVFCKEEEELIKDKINLEQSYEELLPLLKSKKTILARELNKRLDSYQTLLEKRIDEQEALITSFA